LNITEEFEVLLVDDGSTDDSLAKMLLFNHRDKRFKIIKLSRNFGLQAAYTAGLTYTTGEYVVMMDGDLQDPPELIRQMYISLIESDNDVVYGKRKSRNEGWFRKMMMYGFHNIFKRILKTDSSDNVGNFAIFKSCVKTAILAHAEKTRYLPGIRTQVGFKQGHVLYNRDERYSGIPKMNLFKLISLALDAIFSFSNFPIRFMLVVGITGLLISIIGLFYVVFSKILGMAPIGWSSTLSFLFVFNSVQITFLGIIGEYIYRIYKETQNRPIFIVEEVIS